MDFEYDIKRSRTARNLRISVFRDGRVLVSKPRWMLDLVARKFVASRREWIMERQREFAKDPKIKLCSGTVAEYRKSKEAALELSKRKCAAFAAMLGLNFNSITVRRQKTRWGSCSKKGNLNFNYKIVFLPEDLQDYLVIHELCHLKEFNHGKKFWDLVATLVPDFKKRRLMLKKIN
jgi:predicted metal-dependent hydrolase